MERRNLESNSTYGGTDIGTVGRGRERERWHEGFANTICSCFTAMKIRFGQNMERCMERKAN